MDEEKIDIESDGDGLDAVSGEDKGITDLEQAAELEFDNADLEQTEDSESDNTDLEQAMEAESGNADMEPEDNSELLAESFEEPQDEEYDPGYLTGKSIYEQDGEVLRSELSNEEMEALLEGFAEDYTQGETMSEADMAVDNINLDELDFNFDADNNIAELESDIADEDLEFIQDVTVYDTVEREDPLSKAIALATEGFSGEMNIGGSYEEKIVVGPDAEGNYAPSRGLKFKVDGEPLKWWMKLPRFGSVPVGMATVAMVLVIVVIAVGVAGFFIIRTLNTMAPVKHELIDNAEPIQQPKYVLNNSSSIYLTTTPVLYMMDIIEIVKLVANEEITELTFRYDVGWDKYKVTLSDNKYREYGLMPESMVKGNYGNLLKFEPLGSGISGIVFTIEEISTGIVNHFPFKFEGGLKVMPVSYLNGQVLPTVDEGININLVNGYFSNNTSDVTFTFQWDSDTQINFDEIYLSIGTKRMQAVAEDIRSYSGGNNTDIYNVKFGAVPSLTGAATLTFGKVYSDYALNMKIDTSPLFRNTPETQKIIMLDDNLMTLERMGAMGPLYVLVSSCMNAEGEKIKADYEAVLTLNDKNGKEYSIVGDCRSADIGADIIFDTRILDNYDEIEGLAISGFTLNRVKVYREDIKASINMDRATNHRSVTDRKAIEAANAYMQAEGFLSNSLAFYYWEGQAFIAEYQVFEEDKIRKYLVSGINDRNEYSFQRSLVSE